MSRLIVLFRFLILILILICVPSMVTVSPDRVASAQVLDMERGLYQSPTFGHLFRWNPENWHVVDEFSGEEGDLLALESDATIVRFAAYDAFNGDPDRCLDDAVERLREQDLHSLEQAVYLDGASAEDHQPGLAYAAFLMTPNTRSQATEYVAQIECRTLIQQASVLETTSVVASEDYANGADDGMLLVDNLALPRGAFVTQPDESRPLTTERTIVDIDTDVMLDLGVSNLNDRFTDDTLPRADRGTHWTSVDVAIENTGETGVEIDVDTISVVDQFGVVVYPSYFEWSEVTGGADIPVQALGSGDSVAVTLVYLLDDDAGIAVITCGCGPDPTVPIVFARLQADPYSVFPPPPFHGCNDLGWDLPTIIVDPAGTEIATMTGTLWATGDRFELLVAIENSGQSRLSIDSRDFLLTVNEKHAYLVDEVAWDLGSDTSERHRLAAGDRTLTLLSFSIAEDVSFSSQLFYRGPEEDQRHEVASIGVGGGCGGGGRPKILVSQ